MRMKMVAALVAAVGVCGNAHAESSYRYGAVFGFGYTFGGSTLGPIHYVDGQTQPFKLGGTYLVKGGEEFRFKDYPLDLQVTIGYHLEQDHSSNANITFSRFPLEGMAYYRMGNSWRVGGGIRVPLGTKFSYEFEGKKSPSVSFSTKVGYAMEVEYFYFKSASVAFRYVVQPVSLNAEGTTYKFNGNHMGALVNLYF